MRILLDTHVWLWTLVSPERIADHVRDDLIDRGNELYLSAASSWEIAIQYGLGKLPLPCAPEEFVPDRMVRDGVLPLPAEHQHALRVATLPELYREPFDRLLVAQAMVEKLALYTADAKLLAYDVDCVLV